MLLPKSSYWPSNGALPTIVEVPPIIVGLLPERGARASKSEKGLQRLVPVPASVAFL